MVRQGTAVGEDRRELGRQPPRALLNKVKIAEEAHQQKRADEIEGGNIDPGVNDREGRLSGVGEETNVGGDADSQPAKDTDQEQGEEKGLDVFNRALTWGRLWNSFTLAGNLAPERSAPANWGPKRFLDPGKIRLSQIRF